MKDNEDGVAQSEQPRRPLSPLWSALIVLGGATGLYHFSTNIGPYLAFKRADRIVTAKVIEAKAAPAGAKKGTPMFRARIVYQYRVGSDVHIGNMDAVKLKPQRQDLITEELARHPVGSVINVGLDPDNPARSTPENFPPWISWLQLVGGLALLLVGGASLARRLFRPGAARPE